MRTAFVAVLIFSSELLLGNEIPDLLYGKNPYRKTPIWVSRSAATAKDGTLRTELFEPHDLDHIREITEKRRAQPRNRWRRRGEICFGESPIEVQVRRDSFQTMAKNASRVLDGTIAEVATGFFLGSPGSLLRIATSDGQSALIYYPSARFIIGGDTYCAVPAFPSTIPQMGDRVLAFVFAQPLDREECFFVTASSDILLETSKGKLVVSEDRAGDRLLRSADFEELRRRVRTLRPDGALKRREWR